jgi:hypothetical protein
MGAYAVGGRTVRWGRLGWPVALRAELNVTEMWTSTKVWCHCQWQNDVDRFGSVWSCRLQVRERIRECGGSIWATESARTVAVFQV